ncbi:transposase [Streptomyces sp. NBC_01007]|nr:transposase [Streptomyces sp. NBC_01007]
MTCLAGAEPVAGAGMPGVQRLQFFLSESPWEVEQVNDRRLELLREQSATAPHDGGVVVIDGSGDRKDGTATANVGRQWLGPLGKTDNGIVTVTTVWTDGRVHCPLHATPCTPSHHFARAWSDPAFRTLNQWWRAWTDKDPLSELQVLIDAVTAGHGIDLCRRIQRTTGSYDERTCTAG